MASAGNPNQAGAFDLQMLFKPSIPNAQIPTSYPTPPSPYPTPPLSGPFSYPPQTPPTFHHYLHYAQDPIANVHAQRPISYPAPSPHLPPPNPNPNPGARLMALLSPNPTANLEPPLPGPAPAAASTAAMLPSAPSQPTPLRLPSSKLPKGRHLVGDRVVYDVDVRLPGELQPQLEVTPITKYVSDPGLVLGRQIAVNRTYICYGLKLGAIRVLNINTALRSLLKGHTQRVTDMAFFAEDVHLLASSSIDGRIFVWKINEGPDEEDKPQITGKVIVAIHMVGDGESFHPRICWHSHKQEILVVAIGNRVLKIDTTKVGKGEVFSAEKPIKCPVEELIDGVQLVGKHEGEVTDLSMCQWMTTRLVSASTDGMVKIWEDRKAVPLVTLSPHDGQPVSSVTFLTAPHRPDHIVLITGGHLNRELKVWASAGEEGWLLPSDSESWKCIQTLDLKSSTEPRAEEAFFNQVIVLPFAGLVLLANAKKNAIYAVHVEYGPSPTATRMDYIAEFTVTMPILSLTGTSDCAPDGEHVVQVYCVQTQAIQQYALDLSQCLPPPLEDTEIEKDSGISRVSEAPRSGGFAALDPSSGNAPIEIPVGSATSKPPHSSAAAIYPVFSGTPELPSLELATSSVEPNPSALPPATSDVADARVASPPLPLSPRLSGRLSGFRNPSNNFEPGSPLGDRCVDPPVLDYSVDRRVDVGRMNVTDVSSLDDSSVKDGTKVGQNDISMVPNSPIAFKHPTHLITPGEILLKAISSSESTLVGQGSKVGEKKVQDVAVNNDIESVEVEVKEVGESGLNQHQELDSQREQRILRAEKKEKTFYSQASDLGIEMARDGCSLSTEISRVEETRQIEDVGVAESFERPLSAGEQGIQDSSKDVPNTESSSATVVAQSPSSAAKGKKQKVKPSQLAGPSSPSASPFNSADSSNEPGSSNGSPSQEAPFTQIRAIQESMKQLMTIQKEMQKQMTAMVAVPVNKEGRRVEAAMGRSMEKALKSNSDALWARIQEENAKQKLERDRIQQITSSISGSMNKEWPTMFEKALKKEIAAVGPAVARAITPILEKNISSAIADSFQRGVGDKAVNQLEKSVNSKLETAVARQIQSQFQTCGKQALQDALRASLESSVIPAFEQACKGMFEQVDAAFQRGMVEHTSAAQQQFESTHSPLALALRDAMSSASSITQSLSGELADGQRNILAFMAAGANQQVMNPLAPQQSNGPLSGLHDMAMTVQQVEAPLDPKKELERLISEHKYGEAFTSALQRSDVTIVSWLCSKVDLQGILSMLPLPLSQGVLLSLLQQLACDIGNETSRKLEWMRDVLVAIDPVDPTITMHVRPIFEQVYQILGRQRTLPITTAAETNNIRLIMHVINSVLMGYK